MEIDNYLETVKNKSSDAFYVNNIETLKSEIIEINKINMSIINKIVSKCVKEKGELTDKKEKMVDEDNKYHENLG